MAYNGYLRDNVETFDAFSTSYVTFTSSLITSTFEALLDTNLKQIEAYTDMVGTMSKNLTTYINETQDEVHDEQVLEYLELLPLKNDQAGILDAGKELILSSNATTGLPELAQIDEATGTESALSLTKLKDLGKAMTGVIPTGNPSNLLLNALGSIAEAVALPPSDASNFDTLNQLNSASTGSGATAADLQKHIFKAVAQRIASNKYALLENMVRLGFMRLVVDKGLIETRLNMSFKEVDKYSKKQVDKVKTKNKYKSRVREKTGLNFFLFKNKKVSRTKNKHLRIEVHKTKEKQSTKNVGSVNTSALVRIEFSTDYQPLDQQ